MPNPIAADLHSHTQASDGEWSPEQLVQAAAQAGLQALALTDHDSVAGVDRAIAEGQRLGVEIVPGCELTVYDGRIERHLLALFIDHHAPAFVSILESMRAHRRTRALAMAAQLRENGFHIEDADVLEAAGSAESIGRPHVAAALIKRGHAPNKNSAMRRFLIYGAVGYVEKFKLQAVEACRAVHAAGGLAILAHPAVEPHDEMIAPLFRAGMDGIEAVYPLHSEVNRRFYRGLASRYEKIFSGGSDFHGPTVRPGITVGHTGIDRTAFEALRAAAALKKRSVRGSHSVSA